MAIAIALVTGVASHRVVQINPWLWICAIVGFCLVAACSIERKFLFAMAVLIATVLLGALAATLEESSFSANDIALFVSDTSHLAQLELMTETEPRVHVVVDALRPILPRQTINARVLRIKTHSQTGDFWADARGQVLVQLEQPHPRLAAGQRVRVTGRLTHPAPPLNPGQFDWEAYYRQRRLVAVLTVNHVDGVEILQASDPNPLERFRESARNVLALGFAAGQSHDHAALRALLLGDRDAETRDLQEGFSRVGAAHLLAVSGLHVAIVAGVIYLFCRMLRCSPRRGVTITMAAVLLYGLGVLPATPALRAVALCIIFGVGQLLHRHPDRLQLLALTCIAMVLYHPLDVYTAGFQLSFGTVLGLLLYARPLARLRRRLEDPHLKVAFSFRPPTRWQLARMKLRRHIMDYLGFGAIAWLISAPLVAMHFNQINAWALLSGLLLFPLVAAGVVAGLLKIVLTLLLPSFAATWAACSLWPIHASAQVIGWLSHLPGIDIAATAPPWWAMIGYYTLLALPLMPIELPNPLRWFRAAPGLAAVAMVMCLPLLGGAGPLPHEESETRITLLAIGAGQIGVVELPTHEVVLIDDGSSSMTDPLRTCLAPYLRSRGIHSISTIYLSHPDFDHISATADTAANFAVRQVVINPVFRHQSRDNFPAQATLDRVDEMHVPVTVLSRPGHVALSESTTLESLWPPPNRSFKTTNNAGLVLKLVCHGKSILFPADIQVDTERELLQHQGELKSDVLVAPHHGSAEASTLEFVKAVNPRVILSSNDRTLSHKQREFDKLIGAIPLYRTHRCGAITVVISKTGEMRIETFLKVEPQRGQ